MEYVLSLLFCTMQNFAMIPLYDAFFERRLQKARFWAIFLLANLMIFIYVNILHVTISSLKIAGCLSILLLMNLALYHGRFWMRLLVSLLGEAMCWLVEFLVDLCLPAALSISYEAFVNDHVLFVVATVGDCLFLILFSLLIRQLHRPRGRIGSAKALVVLLVPLTSLVLLFPLYTLFFRFPEAFPLLILSVAVLICVNIGAFILIDWLEQNALIRERLAAQERNVEALSAAYARQRKLTHDFRQHLSALSGLLPEDAAPDAARYLDELQGMQAGRLLAVNTHHPAIDAVLNQKAQDAKKQGIDIRFKVNDLAALRLRETDCTAVLGNLLDNAIEACQKLPQPERWVEAAALLRPAGPAEDGVLLVSVANASGPVSLEEGGPRTSKSDSALHGFGLQNVRDILAHYGTEPELLYQDGAFRVSLVWPDRAR